MYHESNRYDGKTTTRCLESLLNHPPLKKKLFFFWSPKTHLEVGALTQDIMADVQMVVNWWLGCFTLDLPVCCRHPQLTGLGERLKVVGRHRPEMKVWVVSKQPAVDHNICWAGSDWSMLPPEINSMIPLIILRSFSVMNNRSSVFHPMLGFFTDLPHYPPSTSIYLTAQLLLGYLSTLSMAWKVGLKVICEKTATVNRLVYKKIYVYVLGGFQVNHRCNTDAERRGWETYCFSTFDWLFQICQSLCGKGSRVETRSTLLTPALMMVMMDVDWFIQSRI